MKRFTNMATVAALLLLSNSSLSGETDIRGFLQGLYGAGLDDKNPTASEMTVSETRLQLSLESFSDMAEFFGRLDFAYDDFNEPAYDWELREGFVKFRIGRNLDFKVGRQIITWGTGDLVFINDVFAKDYRSFFIGRDDQYLKAPQNAVRVSYYNAIGAFTAVYTPRFTPNRIPTGRRLSFFSPMAGEIIGGDSVAFSGRMPEAKLSNGELAGRFSRYIGSADLAMYAYLGFFKNPAAMDMSAMEAYYPRLNVYGASLRFPVLDGIAWLEAGYNDSRDDLDGDDPTIPNSSISGLIGFERSVTSDLTVNAQYQNETTLDYDKYLSTLPQGMLQTDEVYHLITMRVTQMLKMETVKVSGFAFYSPSDEDLYGRFLVSYKYTDELELAVGGNLFHGEEEYTDFGSFDRNDNVFLKATYGF